MYCWYYQTAKQFLKCNKTATFKYSWPKQTRFPVSGEFCKRTDINASMGEKLIFFIGGFSKTDNPRPTLSDVHVTWDLHYVQPAAHGSRFIIAFDRSENQVVTDCTQNVSPREEFDRDWTQIIWKSSTLPFWAISVPCTTHWLINWLIVLFHSCLNFADDPPFSLTIYSFPTFFVLKLYKIILASCQELGKWQRKDFSAVSVVAVRWKIVNKNDNVSLESSHYFQQI